MSTRVVRLCRPQPSLRLSAREAEIAALVAEGRLNKEIGRVLGLAETTVKSHLAHAFRKTSSANRVELALWWLRASGQLR